MVVFLDHNRLRLYVERCIHFYLMDPTRISYRGSSPQHLLIVNQHSLNHIYFLSFWSQRGFLWFYIFLSYTWILVQQQRFRQWFCFDIVMHVGSLYTTYSTVESSYDTLERFLNHTKAFLRLYISFLQNQCFFLV